MTEGEAVEGGDAVADDSFAVLLRRITGIVVPAVVGKTPVKFRHAVIAIGLGEYGSCGDAEVFAIALDNGGVGNAGSNGAARGGNAREIWLETIAIDNDKLRTQSETIERAVHGEYGGVEDVDAVNLLVRHDANGPRQSVSFNLLAQGIAAFRRQLF